MFSFHDLEEKFGAAAAYHWLMEIEKVARIASSDMVEIDPEMRLVNALHAQDSFMQVSCAA